MPYIDVKSWLTARHMQDFRWSVYGLAAKEPERYSKDINIYSKRNGIGCSDVKLYIPKLYTFQVSKLVLSNLLFMHIYSTFPKTKPRDILN